MFRKKANKDELIAAIKVLPPEDIPLFLESKLQTLDAMNRAQLNGVANVVMSQMISCQLSAYARFEEDIKTVIKYFGEEALAPYFAAYIIKYVNEALPFIERHAAEISRMFSPEKLLEFLGEIIGKLFDEYPTFSLNDLMLKVMDSHGYKEYLEHDRYTGMALFALRPYKGVDTPLLEWMKGRIAAYLSDGNANLLSADVIYKACEYIASTAPANICIVLKNGDASADIIRDAKAQYDQRVLQISAFNLANANKLISLFSEKLSAVSDIRVVKQFMEKVKAYDDACCASVANVDMHSQYSLALRLLRAMRQAVKRNDMVAMAEYVGQSSRMQYLQEQEEHLVQRNHRPFRSMFSKSRTTDRQSEKEISSNIMLNM